MIAHVGWRHLFATWCIVIVIAAIALGMSGLPRVFDFALAGPASHSLTNPRHDPAAAHNPPSNVIDPFYDETEMNERHAGRH